MRVRHRGPRVRSGDQSICHTACPVWSSRSGEQKSDSVSGASRSGPPMRVISPLEISEATALSGSQDLPLRLVRLILNPAPQGGLGWDGMPWAWGCLAC